MNSLFNYDDCNFMDMWDLGIDFQQEDMPSSAIEICNDDMKHFYERSAAVRVPAKKSVFRSKTLNSRRKASKTLLYAFPSFDKCDSLIYLPHTFARHINTGDNVKLEKMVRTYFSSNCQFDCDSLCNVSIENFAKMFEIMDELQPDRIACVHTTKVEGNMISATLYKKYTSYRCIHDAVARQHRESEYDAFIRLDHADGLLRKIDTSAQDERERVRMRALVQSGADLLVYLSLAMQLTVDDRTKKVSKIKVRCTLTSLQVAVPLSETA